MKLSKLQTLLSEITDSSFTIPKEHWHTIVDYTYKQKIVFYFQKYLCIDIHNIKRSHIIACKKLHTEYGIVELLLVVKYNVYSKTST